MCFGGEEVTEMRNGSEGAATPFGVETVWCVAVTQGKDAYVEATAAALPWAVRRNPFGINLAVVFVISLIALRDCMRV